MMLRGEPDSDLKPCAGGRIFFRTEPLCDRGDAWVAAAFRDCASARIASSASASVGDRRCCRAVPHRIFRGQDSLRRHDLGCRSHVYSAAGRGGSRVRSRRGRGSGMALGSGASCRWSGADVARDESKRAGGGQYESGAIQQLDAKFGGGCASGLAVLAGQRSSGCDDDCRRCPFGPLRIFALSPFPVCAARDPEIAGCLKLVLFQVEREPV
jgi:hypothetical protein